VIELKFDGPPRKDQLATLERDRWWSGVKVRAERPAIAVRSNQ